VTTHTGATDDVGSTGNSKDIAIGAGARATVNDGTPSSGLTAASARLYRAIQVRPDDPRTKRTRAPIASRAARRKLRRKAPALTRASSSVG
jgi:hypothetical protein